MSKNKPLPMKKNGKFGFTVIEILITTFILSVIFSILYATFFPTLKVIRSLENKREGFSILEGGLRVLSHDIRTSSLPVRNKRAIFKGNNTEQTVIALSSYTSYQPGGINRLRRVEYSLEEDPENRAILTLRRKILRSDDEVLEDDLLFDGLDGIEFFYYNGKKWKTEWDSGVLKKLPQWVKVRLTIGGEEFTSTIPIPVEGS